LLFKDAVNGATLVAWNVKRQSESARLKMPANGNKDFDMLIIRDFVLSHDGAQAVVFFYPRGPALPTVCCWDAAANKVLWDMKERDEYGYSLALSPNKEYVALADPGEPATVSILAARTMKKVRTMRVDRAWNLTFSPDGNSLAFFAAGIESDKTLRPVVCVWAHAAGELAVLPKQTSDSAGLPGWIVAGNPVFSQTGDRLLALDALQVTVWERRGDSKGSLAYQPDTDAQTAVRRAGKSGPAGLVDDKPAPKEPRPNPRGRKLLARIKTVSKENLDHVFTQHLQNLSVSATANQIVIEFDVDRKSWQPVTRSYSLLVRVFDSNGKYLTHFITKESFTAQPQVFDGWVTMQARIPLEVREKLLPGFMPVLLEPQKNRFVYGVDPVFLRRAAIVEVGLLYVKKGPL
jgi:hypothetical protein